jgi:hypothetical protein
MTFPGTPDHEGHGRFPLPREWGGEIYAGPAPAFDANPARQFPCMVFWLRQVYAVFDLHRHAEHNTCLIKNAKAHARLAVDPDVTFSSRDGSGGVAYGRQRCR